MMKRLFTVSAAGWLLLFTAGIVAPAAAQDDMLRCSPKPLGDPLRGAMWNGWGADLANSRFQPGPSAGLTLADVPKLAVKWAVGFPNREFAAGQPTVVGGRVYIGAGPGAVYSLDAETGCVYWRFPTHQIVRTSITIGSVGTPARAVVFFGDLQANVYAVDAETGTNLWTKRMDLHPSARITGAPQLHQGRLYVPISSLEEAVRSAATYQCCTFRGQVVALDAASGQEIWRTFIIDQAPQKTRVDSRGRQQWGPSGGAVWNSPTIDPKRGVLYIGTGNAYSTPAAPTTDSIMALDLKTGAKVWWNQLTPNDAWIAGCDTGAANRPADCPAENGPDWDFGQSPILRDLPDGRSILAVGQKSGIGYGLDPDKKGALVWKVMVGKGGIRGGMLFGSSADTDRVYFGLSDVAHGPEQAGGLAAVTLAKGERVWFTRPPPIVCTSPAPDHTNRCIQGQNAAVTSIPGVVFSGATNGILRAYSTADGKIVWEHDTARSYDTVNRLPAKGGMLYGPGPVIVDGVMYMSAGYGETRGGIPGNVLLAFAPQR